MIGRVEITSLIDRYPAIRAGRPKIGGTGATLTRVAAWYKMGLSPEHIAAQYGHLTRAGLLAALAYYRANLDLSEKAFADGAIGKKEEK